MGMFGWQAVYAFTPTAAQIEQFKRMTPEEQKKIAEQLGVDLSQLQPSQNSTTPTLQPQQNQPRAVAPDYTSVTGTDQNQDIDDKIELGLEDQTELWEQEQGEEPELRLYGYDLFENNTDAFMPAEDIPVPADYLLGPGDSLAVQLYGKENASYNFTVSREGVINFPEIGPISVIGLTFTQLQSLLNRTISEQMIGVRGSVTMGAIRTIRVFVLGEAAQPGSFVVSALSTMTNALFASGGITQIGSLRNVQLKRKGKLVTTLDLYDLLLNGDTSKDARLASGDVIFIPPIGDTASVDGEVRRPAIYELKNETTAGQLVSLAGGMLPSAYPSESKIERIDSAGNRTVVDVNLNSADGKKLKLKSADALIVYGVLDTLENVVTLEGHVKRPGLTAWKPGMKVQDVIKSIHTLMPNADLNSALIQRETQPSRKTSVIAFNLSRAIINPSSNDNIELQPRDKIIIFDLKSERAKSENLLEIIDILRMQSDRANPEKTVVINGSVRFPGVYPLAENMNSKQLIDLAGGLTQNAYDLNSEVTRSVLDNDQRKQLEYQIVDLSQAALFKLKEQDTLNIRQLPEWAPEETVTISGEVVFPGTYTIRPGETLAQVINRAGGFTKQAYPMGAVFTRVELRELEQQRLLEIKQKLQSELAALNIEQQNASAKVDTEDAEQLLNSIETIEPLGRMVIDLPQQMEVDTKNGVYLVGGDKLFVPRYKQSVTVVGEVQFPTSHLYDDSLDVQEYIERSGGTSIKADKKRIYVVKANGRVVLPSSSAWFIRNNSRLEPGDTVVVPLDADRIKSLTLWSSVSEIFYQIALAAAAVASF